MFKNPTLRGGIAIILAFFLTSAYAAPKYSGYHELDELSEVLSKDPLFIEYVNLRQLQSQKLKKLDQQDLKSLHEFTKDRSLEKARILFAKAGVDVESYSKSVSNLTQKLEEKYHLSLLEKRNEIVAQAFKKIAVSLNMSPNCSLQYMVALLQCQALYPDWGDGYIECLMWADLIYITCVFPE